MIRKSSSKALMQANTATYVINYRECVQMHISNDT